MLVDATAVRDYMALNQTEETSQYSDATIGSNIRSAQSFLERESHRYLAPRTFTSDAPWKTTTMLRAQVPIGGFRTFSSVSFGGSTLVENQSFWAIPDPMQTGIYVAMQFRAFRADASGKPWWMADSQWFDKALDSPFYPGNYGGGYFYSSMPNDLLIAGEAGFDPSLEQGTPGAVPDDVMHAVLVLASFYTVRPAAFL